MKDWEELREDVREVKTDVKLLSKITERNTVSLENHMSRTAINEARIRQVENWLMGFLASILLSLVGYLLKG